jgi:UDP-N-acetylglucosamine 4-epimerase
MDRYDALVSELRAEPKRWLVTGAGGFIGSHLVQRLLELGQTVVGLDDFSTRPRSARSRARSTIRGPRTR